MKVKNYSNHPKNVAGVRLEPGDVAELEDVSKDELPRDVEEFEESGESDSDLNTKEEAKSDEDSDQGGEE